MREESHLDEMRSAIRGDFERLAERRGEQDLLRLADPEPATRTDGETTESVPDADVEPEPQPEPQPEDAEPRRSWLARFLAP